MKRSLMATLRALFALLVVLLPTGIVFADCRDFAGARTFVTDALPEAIAVGDFNGDGKGDVAVFAEPRQTFGKIGLVIRR